MNSFNDSALGYNKKEVNEFVDYVIKKTEDNILTIKNQQEEIKRLKEQLLAANNKCIDLERMRKEDLFTYQKSKDIVDRESRLIIQEAKDNASRIVNEALLQAKKIEMDKENLNKTIHMCKKNLRMTLNRQIEMIDEIEIL